MIKNKYKEIIDELDILLNLKKEIDSVNNAEGEKFVNKVLIDLRIEELQNNIIYLRKSEISLINNNTLSENDLFPHIFNIKHKFKTKKGK